MAFSQRVRFGILASGLTLVSHVREPIPPTVANNVNSRKRQQLPHDSELRDPISGKHISLHIIIYNYYYY